MSSLQLSVSRGLFQSAAAHMLCKYDHNTVLDILGSDLSLFGSTMCIGMCVRVCDPSLVLIYLKQSMNNSNFHSSEAWGWKISLPADT